MTTLVRLHWRPSPLALATATCCAAALALAVITARIGPVVFAAPLLGAVAGGCALSRPGREVEVRVDESAVRCFEGETVHLRIVARILGGTATVAADPVLPSGLELTRVVRDGPEWMITAHEWGRHPVAARLRCGAAGGMLAAWADVELAQVRVFPHARPASGVPRPLHLPDRIGAHTGRRRGEGVEFGGIRPYVFGDRLREINWAVSARRGETFVTERLRESAADLVALIDTCPAPDPVARDCLDLAVNGAVQVIQAALRRGDRAGVVTIGGRTRWLVPDIGARQFYQVVDTVLDSWPALRPSSGGPTAVPRNAVPHGAAVIAFSPLIDARIELALNALVARGCAVAVVDVLRSAPTAAAPLALRLWHLQRRVMYRDFEACGIPVVAWPEGTALAEVFAPLAREALGVRTR